LLGLPEFKTATWTCSRLTDQLPETDGLGGWRTCARRPWPNDPWQSLKPLPSPTCTHWLLRFHVFEQLAAATDQQHVRDMAMTAGDSGWAMTT
jgi:hypothetical protein